MHCSPHKCHISFIKVIVNKSQAEFWFVWEKANNIYSTFKLQMLKSDYNRCIYPTQRLTLNPPLFSRRMALSLALSLSACVVIWFGVFDSFGTTALFRSSICRVKTCGFKTGPLSSKHTRCFGLDGKPTFDESCPWVNMVGTASSRRNCLPL